MYFEGSWWVWLLCSVLNACKQCLHVLHCITSWPLLSSACQTWVHVLPVYLSRGGEQNCRSYFPIAVTKEGFILASCLEGKWCQQQCRWLVASHPCQGAERDECWCSTHHPVHGWCVCEGCACYGTCVTAEGQPCRVDFSPTLCGFWGSDWGLLDKCFLPPSSSSSLFPCS